MAIFGTREVRYCAGIFGPVCVCMYVCVCVYVYQTCSRHVRRYNDISTREVRYWAGIFGLVCMCVCMHERVCVCILNLFLACAGVERYLVHLRQR